jgi:peptidoglycan/xylan/chitin deacetylase (PgdA/CDA1 family)
VSIDGTLAVVTYHAIDYRPSVTSLSPEMFRWQMEALAARGFAGISLAQAFDHLQRTGRYPSNAVVLTFDDGYRSVLEHALPVMAVHGFSATAFLVTSLVGMRAAQAKAVHPEFDRDLLTWRQAEAWVRSGCEIGSHTLNHPDLTRLSRDALEEELGQSREILEQRLQTRVDALAYPYGYFNAAVITAAARHYRRACTTRLGRCPAQPDLLQLQRVDAYYLRRRQRLLQLLDGGGAGWLQLRQFLRDLKQVSGKPGR